MPMITGSVFLAGALLSCLLPISLLICFATFFTRNARKLPPNATPPSASAAPRAEPSHDSPGTPPSGA